MPIPHSEPVFVHISEKAPYGLSNKHIHFGYRKNFNTISHILKSIFMWHNETVNIWTHLIGAFFFFWGIICGAFYIEPFVETKIRNFLSGNGV